MSSTSRFAPPTDRSLGRTVVVLVVSAVVICAVEVGIGWLITHPLKSALTHENSVNRWFADQRTSGLTHLADLGTFVGETLTGLVALAVLGVLCALWQRSWWPGVFVLAPVRILQSGLVPDHSFPSGHTGTATAIAGAAAALLWAYTRIARGWLLVLAVIPAWTMLARLYEGAHHLSDVLIALVVTLVWLVVCARLLLPARGGPER
jgi:membrane-associated phospholipid phosphatase